MSLKNKYGVFINGTSTEWNLATSLANNKLISGLSKSSLIMREAFSNYES